MPLNSIATCKAQLHGILALTKGLCSPGNDRVHATGRFGNMQLTDTVCISLTSPDS